MKPKTTTQFERLQANTTTQVELPRRDLKIWFGGMLVVLVGALSAMVTLLPHVAK